MKILVQTGMEDINKSEEVRTYHHENHKRKLIRSSILTLETENSLTKGNKQCAKYLAESVSSLLEGNFNFDLEAQSILLNEISPIFTTEVNLALTAPPTIKEVKKTLQKSNPHTSPGSDSISNYFFLKHFDIIFLSHNL